jgi:hypothetical protein
MTASDRPNASQDIHEATNSDKVIATTIMIVVSAHGQTFTSDSAHSDIPQANKLTV